MTLNTMYWPISRKVMEHIRMPTPVMMLPHSIGFFGPNRCSSFSPTRMVARIATRYPSVSSPDCNDDRPAANWTRPSETIRVPAAPLSRKLESVAPVKVLFLNNFRSTNAVDLLVSICRNTRPNTTKAASSAIPVQLSQPMLGPCEM